MSNTLTQINTELDSQIGFTERIRLTPEERNAAINQAIEVVYGLLSGSSVIRGTGTVTITSTGAVSPITGVGTLPSDFNDGTVLDLRDGTDYNSSDPVPELDESGIFHWDDTNSPSFVRRYNATTNAAEFHFKGVTTATYTMEYERGAPVLVSGTDTDNLPVPARRAIGKVAAGILTDNALADSSKMQIMLYGPSGNASRYSPDSVMAILARVRKSRRMPWNRNRPMRISLIENRRSF